MFCSIGISPLMFSFAGEKERDVFIKHSTLFNNSAITDVLDDAYSEVVYLLGIKDILNERYTDPRVRVIANKQKMGIDLTNEELQALESSDKAYDLTVKNAHGSVKFTQEEMDILVNNVVPNLTAIKESKYSKTYADIDTVFNIPIDKLAAGIGLKSFVDRYKETLTNKPRDAFDNIVKLNDLIASSSNSSVSESFMINSESDIKEDYCRLYPDSPVDDSVYSDITKLLTMAGDLSDKSSTTLKTSLLTCAYLDRCMMVSDTLTNLGEKLDTLGFCGMVPKSFGILKDKLASFIFEDDKDIVFNDIEQWMYHIKIMSLVAYNLTLQPLEVIR